MRSVVSSFQTNSKGNKKQGGIYMRISITPVYDHFEVYINGRFYCSADTWIEAVREIEEYKKEMCLI